VYRRKNASVVVLPGQSIRAKGIKNFSLYSKRVSGAILVVVGIYYGVTYITYIYKYANA